MLIFISPQTVIDFPLSKITVIFSFFPDNEVFFYFASDEGCPLLLPRKRLVFTSSQITVFYFFIDSDCFATSTHTIVLSFIVSKDVFFLYTSLSFVFSCRKQLFFPNNNCNFVSLHLTSVIVFPIQWLVLQFSPHII